MKSFTNVSRLGVKRKKERIAYNSSLIFRCVFVDVFASDQAKFAAFFGRVIRLVVPTQSSDLPLHIRRYVLEFLIHCFQSFENPLLSRECRK